MLVVVMIVTVVVIVVIIAMIVMITMMMIITVIMGAMAIIALVGVVVDISPHPQHLHQVLGLYVPMRGLSTRISDPGSRKNHKI